LQAARRVRPNVGTIQQFIHEIRPFGELRQDDARIRGRRSLSGRRALERLEAEQRGDPGFAEERENLSSVENAPDRPKRKLANPIIARSASDVAILFFKPDRRVGRLRPPPRDDMGGRLQVWPY
jgi:hypothetical protein